MKKNKIAIITCSLFLAFSYSLASHETGDFIIYEGGEIERYKTLEEAERRLIQLRNIGRSMETIEGTDFTIDFPSRPSSQEYEYTGGNPSLPNRGFPFPEILPEGTRKEPPEGTRKEPPEGTRKEPPEGTREGIFRGRRGGGGGGGLDNPLAPLGNTFQEIVNSIITGLIFLAVPVVTVMVIWGAFNIMTAGGSPDRAKKGGQIILWAAVGFGVLLLSKGVAAIIESLISGAF